ncbi:MAG: RagB/SusD family nutrient uptake outer membrane protein [Porphyromonadaceae bacterium]|nr:MAG: RagB/SusD family nutrient uptake outer membrane protein [Porphyromonadaceae bacterium]
MKKIRYIAYAAIVIFGMQACTKSFLELEPKTGLVEDNFYKTENDAFLALTAVYQALAVQNWQFIPLMSDIFSDDAFAGGADAGDMSQWQEIELSRMTDANGSASDLWNRCYTAIYRANLYLEKEGGITWTNPANQKRFAAEAKFIRGYIFWDLARHYGWVPIITSVLPSIDDYRSVTQNNPSEVYTQVAKDLLDALPDLPDIVPSTEVGRVTKYAAEALIARIYLYHTGIKTAIPELGLTGAWTNGTTTIDKAYVQTALDDIITNGGYTLLPNYADLFDWAHQNSSESIFELQYSEKAKSGDWGGWGIHANFSVIFYGMRNAAGFGGVWDAGWSFATITWSLVNEYEAGDPRKDATIFNADAESGTYLRAFENTGYFNKKWMPRSAFQATAGSRELNYPANFIDIRLADVLLMASEMYLTDNPSKAKDYLNLVRTRAMGASAALNTVTLNDILHERRVELAGEGSRKWDLLRQGLNYTKTKIDASFNVPSTAPNKQDFQGRAFDPQTYGMFPIPGVEIRNCNTGVLNQYVPKYK